MGFLPLVLNEAECLWILCILTSGGEVMFHSASGSQICRATPAALHLVFFLGVGLQVTWAR